jgi:hypothetical protein
MIVRIVYTGPDPGPESGKTLFPGIVLDVAEIQQKCLLQIVDTIEGFKSLVIKN